MAEERAQCSLIVRDGPVAGDVVEMGLEASSASADGTSWFVRQPLGGEDLIEDGGGITDDWPHRSARCRSEPGAGEFVDDDAAVAEDASVGVPMQFDVVVAPVTHDPVVVAQSCTRLLSYGA